MTTKVGRNETPFYNIDMKLKEISNLKKITFMSSTSIQTILFYKPKQNDERTKYYLLNKSKLYIALMNS